MSGVPTQTFAAPRAEVVKAAELTIGLLGLGITETRVSDPTTQIFFTKAISAFSWGEVGRIDVTGLTTTGTSGSSVVAITSAKRSTLQITGTSEKEFAQQIFSGISMRLNK